MAYPDSVDSFTTKTDNIDIVEASHVNSLQTSIVAIETELGTLPKGGYADVKTRLNTLEATASFLTPTGRLTLETGVPISTTDQVDKTT